MSATSSALIVFAKAPEAGQVKTRLTTKIPEEAAARLYQAFIRDALAEFSQVDAAIRLYIAPPVSAFFDGQLCSVAARRPQVGQTLGDRMRNAFDETFTEGFRQVIIVGTDHPTLPLSFVDDAFQKLKADQQIVLGPSRDGGYYLMGMNRFCPFLFEEMEYSHRRVLADTARRAEAYGITPFLLPTWYDVDTPGDLKRLISDLEENPGVALHTRRVLRSMNLLYA